MRKKKAKKKSNSFKMLVLYGAIVFCLILVSLTIRVFSLIKESKFDGQHRFTLAIGGEKQLFGLISFEPVTSSLSLLTFSRDSNLSFSNFNSKMGVVPDGYIKTRYNLAKGETIPSILQSFIIQLNAISTNINFYDLLRLYLYANKLPNSTVIVEELSLSSDPRVINKTLSFLLADSVIAAENVSVQIVNAAGESGLGGRLERVITNLGGNVVFVKTALAHEPVSKIKYYGNETYTLQKLERLLNKKSEILDREAIAKIVIIIGEDSKDTLLF